MELLQQRIETYLQYLRYEQGVTKSTYKSYQAYLRVFLTWLSENGYPTPTLTDFNAPVIKRYFYSVSEKGLRPRSVYGYMIPLRSFGQWLVTQGVREENPAYEVRLPKKDHPRRKPASEAEIAQLLEAVERQRNKKKVAFQRAVLAVLVFSGLRRAEVCDLRLEDVDLTGGWLTVVNGKGQKSRRVPLCTELKDALAAWLVVRPNCPHPYLFCVDSKRRLYFAGLRSVVEEVKHLAGLAEQEHISPHSLRHAAATRLLRNGADLKQVQVWLGHSQLTTTANYLHCAEEQLQEVVHLASLCPTKPEAEPKDDGKVIDLLERQRRETKGRRLRRSVR